MLLQNGLSTIMNWCSKWLMALNYSKWKPVRFTRKCSISSCIHFLDTQSIEAVTSYPSVLLTSDTSWTAHIEKTSGYIRRCLHCPWESLPISLSNLCPLCRCHLGSPPSLPLPLQLREHCKRHGYEVQIGPNFISYAPIMFTSLPLSQNLYQHHPDIRTMHYHL